MIYFSCRRYRTLSAAGKEKVRDTARAAADGDEYLAKAIFRFMTTPAGFLEVCDLYHISEASLSRLRKRFFEVW